MKVCILQVDRCKPIEKTDTLKDAFLHQHPEWELVKGPDRSRIGRSPPPILDTMKQGLLNPDFISAGWTGSIASFTSRTAISASKTEASLLNTEMDRMPLN